jgi:hypothetical protein
MTNQNIADSIIKLLFEVGVDGETMEYIIDKLGMKDQMIKQLITDKEEPEKVSMPKTMAVFTRQQLIEYTREIQERCKLATTEAVKNAGIDFEYMVELELEYDKTITVSFDEGALYREIESAIDDAIETDDDSVFDEATNVITFMTKR